MPTIATSEAQSPESPSAIVTPEQQAPAKQSAPVWITSLWVSTTYFAEGLPYMVVRWLASVYATAIGLPEGIIGALNLLSIPWSFKFVWAPVVDWIGTKRGWMVKVQLAIALCCGVLAALVRLGPAESKVRLPKEAFAAMIDPHTGLAERSILIAMAVVLSVLAFLAATNDVTIDAFYIAGLPSKVDQAAYSGLRTTAYRMAVVFAKAALIGIGAWYFGFAVAAATMGVLALLHALALPQFEVERQRHELPPFMQHLTRALMSFLDQPRIPLVLAFLVMYKLGDEVLLAMKSTFLLRELKLSMPQFKFVSVWIETPTLISGTMLGAWLLKRFSLRRMAMPLTLIMSTATWGVVWLAWAKPDPKLARGFLEICVLHGCEQVALGLGLAAFTLFIVYMCKPEFKAAHFAIGTAISSLGGTVLGSVSGRIVELHGYTVLYVIAFVCSLPAIGMLPFMPMPETDR